jgi:hypothetical protein
MWVNSGFLFFGLCSYHWPVFGSPLNLIQTLYATDTSSLTQPLNRSFSSVLTIYSKLMQKLFSDFVITFRTIQQKCQFLSRGKVTLLINTRCAVTETKERKIPKLEDEACFCDKNWMRIRIASKAFTKILSHRSNRRGSHACWQEAGLNILLFSFLY